LTSWRAEGNLFGTHLMTFGLPRQEILRECFPDILANIDSEQFAQLFAASGALYCDPLSRSSRSRYISARQFVEKAIELLPELHSISGLALSKCNDLEGGKKEKRAPREGLRSSRGTGTSKSSLRGHDAWYERAKERLEEWTAPGARQAEKMAVNSYIASVKAICSTCTCGNHPYRCSSVAACQTIITLAYLLGELVFDDDLCLSRLGLRHLYEMVFQYRLPLEGGITIPAILYLSNKLENPARDFELGFSDRFEIYLILFSGFEYPNKSYSAVAQRISAISRNGLYCYVDLLREPFQSFQEASRIHIGRGAIHTSGRTYDMILDQDEGKFHHDHSSTGEGFPETAVHPRAKALIEENITLRFWY